MLETFGYLFDRLGSRKHWLSLLIPCAVLGSIPGCGPGPKAEFSYRASTDELLDVAKKASKQVLKENFGTPNELVAWERLPVDYGGVRAEIVAEAPLKLAVTDPLLAKKIKAGQSVLWLSGEHAGTQANDRLKSFDAATLQVSFDKFSPKTGDKFSSGFGEQLQLGRVVYMKNCLHCHGVAGDGAGPTAKYLNPRPRDYRLGIFKFTSTLSAERITRDDLQRIISYGIPGTYMPSFLLMKDDEKTAVVEYVRWLAMRGEMEKRLGDELADYNKPSIEKSAQQALKEYDEAGRKGDKPGSVSQAIASAVEAFKKYEKEEFPGIIDETAKFLAETWTKAEDAGSVIVPKVARVADTPESRERGRLLYMSNRTKCYTCHGPLGRGDGGAVDDFWKNPLTNENYEHRGLHDLWGNKLQPRDLTKGQYRGGRRPLDIYRRIFAGIKGTPMPAFGGNVLKDEEIWDLVNFVMNVPYDPPASSAPQPAAMAATQAKTKSDH